MMRKEREESTSAIWYFVVESWKNKFKLENKESEAIFKGFVSPNAV
jgi:hypothetical protein